jgi:glutaminase
VVVVVPGVLGLAVYSPRLSPQMKSVAGTKFCEALATAFPSLVQASH